MTWVKWGIKMNNSLDTPRISATVLHSQAQDFARLFPIALLGIMQSYLTTILSKTLLLGPCKLQELISHPHSSGALISLPNGLLNSKSTQALASWFYIVECLYVRRTG